MLAEFSKFEARGSFQSLTVRGFCEVVCRLICLGFFSLGSTSYEILFKKCEMVLFSELVSCERLANILSRI